MLISFDAFNTIIDNLKKAFGISEDKAIGCATEIFEAMLVEDIRGRAIKLLDTLEKCLGITSEKAAQFGMIIADIVKTDLEVEKLALAKGEN